MILKTSIKFWPAEYHSQSAIEATLRLRQQIGNLEKIESILSEALRPSCRQGRDLRRGDDGTNPRRCRSAGGRGFPHRRSHGCASGRGFRRHRRACAGLSRSRSRRHLSRGSGNRARVSRFRPQNRSAADGEHDRVRPQPATERIGGSRRWATASPSSDSPRSASRCTPSANVCAI